MTTTLNLYGHVCPPPKPPWSIALDAIFEQCDEGDDAAVAQGS
jgi:hypothetical protein